MWYCRIGASSAGLPASSLNFASPSAANAGSAGANTVMACWLLRVSTRLVALTAATSLVSSGFVDAAEATGRGPIESSEPGAEPCGSCEQAGPKTSALVVTPSAAAVMPVDVAAIELPVSLLL